VSYSGHNWSAKWWTQNEAPGGADVWADQGSCTGGSGGGGGTACSYPNWVAGQWYGVGSIVRYTDGNHYIAVHENPGYDPVISHWYWDPYTCTGPTNPPDPSGFVVSQAQFDQMFPSRNSFYTYSGLVSAMSAFPAFAKTGSDTIKKQEAAAFLANANHETGGLVHIVEQNTANYPHYCDASQPY
ncbi:glycoside hydrolase family 19 protein, partial [Streptomonospora nanhaiensis]|uniref:glycoside hydrolase family 19 protein n=1 Tax=Streptomonospora nanhaiensis TaxID=1323731 RepID=UPI00360E4492